MSTRGVFEVFHGEKLFTGRGFGICRFRKCRDDNRHEHKKLLEQEM
jgi:hypothetical protein